MRAEVVLVRGSGDVGSAVAHRLFRAGYGVVVHDVAAPTAHRRGMAFTDAIFDGSCELAGIEARRVDAASGSEALIAMIADRRVIPITTAAFDRVLAAVVPGVLVDARMRKRARAEVQRGLAPLTIGLGPNFVAGDTTDLAVETSWGDRLGEIVEAGPTSPLAGEPRTYGGHARDRFVYAPRRGLFRTDAAIAQIVRPGEVVASIDGQELVAPLGGILRGLTRDGVPVEAGTKVVEVDPRGERSHVIGIGERPGRIADGVLEAVTARLAPR
jgi:xanthine dehydrogenase accessory factor